MLSSKYVKQKTPMKDFLEATTLGELPLPIQTTKLADFGSFSYIKPSETNNAKAAVL